MTHIYLEPKALQHTRIQCSLRDFRTRSPQSCG